MSVIKSSPLESCENNMDLINTIHNVKEMLKSKIFLGRYLERRLINKHIGYRDVVLVSPAEFELKKVLLEARQKLLFACPKTHWIGISDSETLGYSSGVSILTEIDNQPFGRYWFQIRSVKFRDSEIIVILKCLRHITDSYLEVEPILTRRPEKLRSSVFNTSAVIETAISYIKSIWTSNYLTEIITLVFPFVVALCSRSITLIKFIMVLIKEIFILLKNCTPMFLDVFGFMRKIIGGVVNLMVLVFKPNKPRPQRGPWPKEHYYIRSNRHCRNSNGEFLLILICLFFIALVYL